MFEVTICDLKHRTRRRQISALRIHGTGIAMLSGVLNTERAIDVNIQIMRTFTRLRQMITVTDDLKRDLDALKELTDQRFHIVFETLDQLLATEVPDKKKIGFTVKEAQAEYDS